MDEEKIDIYQPTQEEIELRLLDAEIHDTFFGSKGFVGLIESWIKEGEKYWWKSLETFLPYYSSNYNVTVDLAECMFETYKWRPTINLSKRRWSTTLTGEDFTVTAYGRNIGQSVCRAALSMQQAIEDLDIESEESLSGL